MSAPSTASAAPTAAPTLGELTEEQRSQRFAELQHRLPEIWGAQRTGREGESIVVVPSRYVDKPDEPAAESQAYEERLLFLLLLLRQPRLRIIYVTSLPIDPSIIDYYLGLLAGVIPAHARARLVLVAAHDGSPRPLSEKLIERPRLLERIRSLIPHPGLSHLVPYSTTPLERDLALLLGIPMYGADPRFLPCGTKTGCRRLFAEEAIVHPFGREGLDSLDDILDGLLALRETRPTATEAIVKLNEAASGRGNAVVDLSELPPPGSADERAELEGRVRRMSFESAQFDFDTYMAKFADLGGIVEERIKGTELRSPSVQVRVTPLRQVEILSTHDQLLGGPSGQRYLGCQFPADPAYAAAITADARTIGERLARDGVLGRFAVDFVVVRDEQGHWSQYAIELNLRKGGTTHPYLTLEFLTEGAYDAEAAKFTSPRGAAKFLVASDHVESPVFRGLAHEDLFDVIVRMGLHFDHACQKGVVFHMMSALSELGRIGLTAVGDTPEEAMGMYGDAEAALLDAGRSALVPPSLPGG
jgi:hypothetical protein